MSKHTPGPWKFEKGDCRTINAADGSNLMGDEKYYPWCPHREEDWHLIAAAPDLLEALKRIADGTAPSATTTVRRSTYLELAIYEIARAAIAKAEGRT